MKQDLRREALPSTIIIPAFSLQLVEIKRLAQSSNTGCFRMCVLGEVEGQDEGFGAGVFDFHAAAVEGGLGDESAQIAALFSDAGFLWVLASFFGFGLLLAFTPCVLPLLPILSGIIVGHGHKVSRARAFVLSLAFVLGVVPLAFASGAGAGARHSAGTGVMGGMLAATFLAIFFIPWFYKLIVDRKLSDKRSTAEIEHEVAHHREQSLRAAHAPHHAPPRKEAGDE